jgi:TonB family protein
MPFNIKKFWAPILLIFVLAAISFAQVSQEEVMRQRIARARAYVAVKNYNAAVYELEGIRRETKDETVQSVALTMLMSVYMEQGDYRRAQDLLIENFNTQKISKKPSNTYYSVAAQVVRSSRNQVERYRQLGLSLNDRNLPTEAIADIEKMRETLELIIKQSDELADLKKQQNESFALVEEASNARVMMSRDDFDSTRWKNKIVDTRDRLANSNAKIINVVEDPRPTPDPNTVAINSPQPTPQPTIIPVSSKVETKNAKTPKPTPTPIIAKIEPIPTPSATPKVEITPTIAKVEPKPVTKSVPTPTPVAPIVEPTPIVAKIEPTPTPIVAKIESNPEPKVEKPTETKNNNDPLSSPLTASNNGIIPETTNTANVENTPKNPPTENLTSNLTSSSLDVGSMIGYATQTVRPSYPAIAKQMRLSGVVRVNVTVNENGEVTEAESISGPSMLKGSAKDAAKRWKFKPFVKEGQPIKATGYIDFNFSP